MYKVDMKGMGGEIGFCWIMTVKTMVFYTQWADMIVTRAV